MKVRISSIAKGVLNSLPKQKQNIINNSVLKLNNDLETKSLDSIIDIKAVKGRDDLYTFRVNSSVRAIIEKSKEDLNLVDIIEVRNPSLIRGVRTSRVKVKRITPRARKSE